MLRFVILQTVNDKVVLERTQEEIRTRLANGIGEKLMGYNQKLKNDAVNAAEQVFNEIISEIKQETIRL